MVLPEGGLQASVEFSSVRVAFLASGTGPFTLAVGRSQTPAAAASLLGSITPDKLNDLPQASVVEVQLVPADALSGMAPSWLPNGITRRSALLWAVLVAGVLLLGGVAYSLMRRVRGQVLTAILATPRWTTC